MVRHGLPPRWKQISLARVSLRAACRYVGMPGIGLAPKMPMRSPDMSDVLHHQGCCVRLDHVAAPDDKPGDGNRSPPAPTSSFGGDHAWQFKIAIWWS